MLACKKILRQALPGPKGSSNFPVLPVASLLSLLSL